jgi:hypothetical protein
MTSVGAEIGPWRTRPPGAPELPAIAFPRAVSHCGNPRSALRLASISRRGSVQPKWAQRAGFARRWSRAAPVEKAASHSRGLRGVARPLQRASGWRGRPQRPLRARRASGPHPSGGASPVSPHRGLSGAIYPSGFSYGCNLRAHVTRSAAPAHTPDHQDRGSSISLAVDNQDGRYTGRRALTLMKLADLSDAHASVCRCPFRPVRSWKPPKQGCAHRPRSDLTCCRLPLVLPPRSPRVRETAKRTHRVRLTARAAVAESCSLCLCRHS